VLPSGGEGWGWPDFEEGRPAVVLWRWPVVRSPCTGDAPAEAAGARRAEGSASPFIGVRTPRSPGRARPGEAAAGVAASASGRRSDGPRRA
jgi:hypothetical protein